MFIFHIFVVLNIFNKTSYSLSNPYLDIIGKVSRNTFVVLFGISLYLSYRNSKNEKDYKKKQIKRSFFLLLCGIYITILTYMAVPDKYVVFGILHYLAIVVLILYNFVNNKLLLSIIFLITIFIQNNYNSNYSYLPDKSITSFIKGISGLGFYKASIDHFPILKWISVTIFGILIGHFLFDTKIIKDNKDNKNNKDNKDNKDPTSKNKEDNIFIKVLKYIGRNSLMLYIIHIPLLFYVIKKL
tara:strand:- start:50 stop:775 length:726 start_codon:yes stop_codon:yes gene_type:complete